MAEALTMQAFACARGLRLSAKRTDSNPHMADSDNMHHWRCTIRSPRGKSFSVIFSKGIGHNGAEPTVEEVLDCLASDAAGYDNAIGFEDWAEEMGFNPDSRAGEKAYNATGKQAERLKIFLSNDDYEELLYKTERL